MPEDPEFRQLYDEALSHPLVGWDFSWVRSRIQRGEFPWNYTRIVLSHARRSPDLLDLGTGGGEWLSDLDHRPERTVATESYRPNLRVAGQRLRPLEVEVVGCPRMPDNTSHLPGDRSPRLPFRDGSFHLVVNRHESFRATEVERVLAPGGRFVTQQVGEALTDELSALFARRPLPASHPRWTLARAREQLESAGLRWVDGAQGTYPTAFRDVGALVWYLRAVPWALPQIDLALERPRLEALHQWMRTNGPLRLEYSGFWLEVEKPGTPRPSRKDPSPSTRGAPPRGRKKHPRPARSSGGR